MGKPREVSLRDRFKYSLSTARGVPIEYKLGPYMKTLREIRAVDLSRETEAGIARRAASLKELIRAGKETPTPRSIMIECYALAAELFRRRLGVSVYDVQLVAGMAMQGLKLAQMATGEGKSFAAAFPTSLFAMEGRGVHLLTANDYLAKRDAEWIRPVYEGLGLSVAYIDAQTEDEERRKAYRADVCYLTAKEAGFDYLRDQLRYDPREYVHRPFHAALVDEADSILIDEARIPLVIAGKSDADPAGLAEIDRMARCLTRGIDFTADPRKRSISFPEAGQGRIDSLLGIEGLHEEAGRERFARLHAALFAEYLLTRDVDYVLRGGRVELVDEFTGRVAESRKWPYGVQAALEAKEGLEIGPEGRIYGSIAIQHFMSVYPKLAAMTATAVPSAKEFFQAYGLSTVIIPPNRPSARIDAPDEVFSTKQQKDQAVADEIAAAHATGRPVLVGTASVADSEALGRVLAAKGVPCEILNAKNHELEAAIISRAGKLKAVTISTNMAGRGTDIRLGGPDPIEGSDGGPDRRRLIELGGLYIIGTNRHESRRIDDQLRGRAGRQGEPGLSRFFVSLEDPLFRLYGIPEFLPPRIEDPKTRSEIDRAQRIIESRNSDLRRSLRTFSLLLEYERRYIRQIRDDALLDGELPERIEEAARSSSAPKDMAVQVFLRLIDRFWSDHLAFSEELREGIHLVRYGGRNPDIEYGRHLSEAFESGLSLIADQAARTILELPEGFGQTDLDAIAPKRPSSTWTYQIDENPLPPFNLAMLSTANAGIQAIAAIPAMIAQAIAKAVSGFEAAFSKRRKK